MSIKKSIVSLFFTAIATAVNASGISGTLSDDSARVNASLTLVEPIAVEAGVLYVSEDDDGNGGGQSAYVGALIQSISDPLEIGIGARFRVVEGELGDGDSGYSAGFGGYYRYIFPNANRFSFYLSAYYYPVLLSYESIERQYEVESRVEYALTENARFYASYNINAIDYIDQEETYRLDETTNLGVSVHF